MTPTVECVPNFSEGRDNRKIEQIVDTFRRRNGVRLLDYSADADHNRMVVTVAGIPEAIAEAVIAAVAVAIAEIDLTAHYGRHPRIGAADVIPFIPLAGMSMDEADNLAHIVARRIAETCSLPVFLYENSASAQHRRNLADIRRGEFEGLAQKMKLPEWQPDFGPSAPHRTAGATVVGARNPLIAWNIVLETDNVETARKIARKIRFSNGGFPACKAIGIDLSSRSAVQVSVNLTDYRQTSMFEIFKAVEHEAAMLGTAVAGSELIGLVPLQAIADTAKECLKMDNFDINRILETNLWSCRI
jgi:glutamate formiminotransferase